MTFSQPIYSITIQYLNMSKAGNIIKLLIGLVIALDSTAQEAPVLDHYDFSPYIEYFNSVDDEPIKNLITNENCLTWMKNNIPRFECPDKEIEEIYYYRWWIFRKHIKETPSGYVITEFLPNVGHAAKYNTIACAAGLHVDEGKWLNNKKYISDYLGIFSGRRYS